MIICCGEALIDMVPVLSDSGQISYAPLVGGAVFNTAMGLGRLGTEVALVSGISNDLFGQQLHDALTASHVDTSFLVRSNLPTTLAFVSLNEGHASYTFYDENSAGRCLQTADLPDLYDPHRGIQSNNHSSNALYFGGISLINEPAADAYCALAMQCADDMVIVLDPNIRTSFINNDRAYRQRLRHMIDVADIIKVSDEDLDWLVGDATTEPEQVGLLRGQSQAIVIVTKGPNGATAYLTTGEAVHQNVPKVCVVDTVGAGDTFNAGLLAKLVHLNLLSKTALANISSTELLASLAYAAQVAAINVSRQGANPPWLNELNV